MNQDHADAVSLYAESLLQLPGTGWRMTGIDPEGLDLHYPMEQGRAAARLDFATPVLTPAAARRTLVALAEEARRSPPGG